MRKLGIGLAAGLAMMFLPMLHAQAPGQDVDPAMQNMAAGSEGTDPPSQVARIAVLEGNVSVEPASVDQFSAAEANYPLTTGDRLYADAGAVAELQTDVLAVRLGQQTDLTVTAMTDALAQFGLASGSVHVRSYSLEPNATLELDTPNVAVTVLQAGDVRVDVDAAADTTTVTVLSGGVEVDGSGLQQSLEAGQSVQLRGGDPVSARWLYAASPDGLDKFSTERDALYQSSLASESQYVNPGTIGAEDLSANGDWETGGDDGPVWYPAGVSVGWQPYQCGHWTWIAPWGWTWVECERWGFAPFHYGRWSFDPGRHRWGWRPGPPVARPIYSPALVVFVGGTRGGVTAWFPLGPKEPYRPWYPTSVGYVNRVNASNIYDRNVSEVRRNYAQKNIDGYGGDKAGVQVYANRQRALVAVSQDGFAKGRPVAGVAVRLSPEEIDRAEVLPHPLVTPERSMVVPGVTRAVPMRQERPMLASHVETAPRQSGGLGIVAKPVGPARTIGNPEQPAPIAREQPAPSTQGNRPQPTYMRQVPSLTEQPPQSQEVRGQPVAPSSPVRVAPERPILQTPAAPLQAPAAPQRPLFNRAVPPEPRPAFEEQRQAIESSDPGRPLSPQQMQNLRQSQPVGSHNRGRWRILRPCNGVLRRPSSAVPRQLRQGARRHLLHPNIEAAMAVFLRPRRACRVAKRDG